MQKNKNLNTKMLNNNYKNTCIQKDVTHHYKIEKVTKIMLNFSTFNKMLI